MSVEINALVAEKVLGWPAPVLSEARANWAEALPRFSADIAAAWRIVEKFAPLAGRDADGWFHLTYSDSANHSTGNEKLCVCPSPQDFAIDDDEDKFPWSAHFHPHDLEDGQSYPANWKDYRFYCARGETAALAICYAGLKAVGERVPGSEVHKRG